MKTRIMRYFMMTCKEATYLTAKKEEGGLRLVESMQLNLHLSMCKFCKRFQKQTETIIREIPQAVPDDHISVYSREELERVINEHIS